ncbi:MAG: hypothetical protein ACO2PN_22600 [Pyrobaculum sp.]|jgi:hypothetical protein
MIGRNKKSQSMMIVIPPTLPQPQVEEVEVCEKNGDKVVCRRRTEKRALLA